MLLKEMFDKVLPWEWVEDNPDGRMAVFLVGENAEYNVTFANVAGGWEIEFGRSEKTSQHKNFNHAVPKSNVTGTGNEFVVFATVIEIVKEFVKEEDPDELTFSAKKAEASRVSLYNRMMKMFPEDRWYTEVTELSHAVHYTIMTKEKWQHATHRDI